MVVGARGADVPARDPVDRLLHPDAGVHDVQRVAVPGAGAGAGRGLLLLRLEEELRRRHQRALPMTTSYHHSLSLNH